MKYTPVHFDRWTTKTELIKETHSRKHYEKWDRMAKDMQIFPLEGKKHKAHCKKVYKSSTCKKHITACNEKLENELLTQ